MKKAKKIFEVLGLIVAIIVVSVFLMLLFNVHADVGYVGDQKVVAMKMFNHLTVFDKEGNDRNYSDVKSFSFSEDSLTILRKKGETVKIKRNEKKFGANCKATLDFSKLTISTDTGDTYYYGVKEIGTDYSKELYILYYDGTHVWVK